jgi:2-oxoisovalerate dehydrogenase E1 component
VGRALGASLASAIGVPSEFPADFVSFVTVGDGSVNHTHFLTAINFAEYANFRRFKCPVIFGIS